MIQYFETVKKLILNQNYCNKIFSYGYAKYKLIIIVLTKCIPIHDDKIIVIHTQRD